MKAKEIAISIRVRHPALSAQDITGMLNSEPTRGVSVGTNRLSPTGQALEGTYPETLWIKRLDIQDSSLRNAIETTLAIVESSPDATVNISQGGGRVEFFVGWFVDGNVGDVLPHALLDRIARLHIDLHFDVYAGRPEDTIRGK